MARIEKTVFISYRRTDVFTALAVYENLKNEGYDVFFDYRNISSGDFEQIITDNIRARAHFILILTPTALDRCSESGDWLRREIEIAIGEKRNIIPLLFKGFQFGAPSVTEKLTGKLEWLSRYNGLNVHEDYFDEAMDRLRSQYLSRPLDTVLHPVSTEVRKVVREQQIAADEALAQIEDVKELVKLSPQIPSQPVKRQNPKRGIFISGEAEVSTNPTPNFKFRFFLRIAGILLFLGFLISASSNIWMNLFAPKAEPTQTIQSAVTFTAQANTTEPEQTATPLAHATIVVTSTLGIGSTMISEDGMILLYVPAGKFQMGSIGNAADERPVHTVYLDDYFIDQTEVTNAMYGVCVQSGKCEAPRYNTSFTRHLGSNSFYYGNPEYDNYPVIHVSWDDAKAYCKFVGRRLPTEAEWEKAASWDDAKDVQRIYPWGNSIDCSYANYYGGENKTLCEADTLPVGSYPKGASFYGVLDMAGNVAEWVLDRYDPKYYADSPEANPKGPPQGDNIVIRGGSFLIGSDNGIRSSDRELLPPGNTSQSVGFRCAIDATATP